MKNMRLIVFALMAAAALVAGIAIGFASTPVLFLGLTAVAVAVAPMFKPLPGSAALACDADPMEVVKELTKDLRTAREDLRKQQDKLADAHSEVMKSVATQTKLAEDVQGKIDEQIAKANEQATIVKEVAQRLEDIKKAVEAGESQPTLTVRGQVQKMLEGSHKDALAKFVSHESTKLVLKDITSADVSTGVKREPHIDTLVSLERQPLRIADLLTVVPVQTDAVKYGKQTLRDNQARIVAEGTSKPYSNYKWEDDTAIIEVVAHLAKMSLQALADAPRLAAEVESEMRYGLNFAEEVEILNGNGTAGHLSGLMHNATAFSVPAGMSDDDMLTGIDVLRVAMLKVHLAYAVPDAHILNPINMAEFDLMRRDPDQGGGYLFSRPDEQTGVTRIWRLPVVETPAMTVGKFLTGAFKYAASLYRRQGATVQISTENEDDFEKNLATMRCESRLGLGVRRGYALVKGDLAAGS